MYKPPLLFARGGNIQPEKPRTLIKFASETESETDSSRSSTDSDDEERIDCDHENSPKKRKLNESGGSKENYVS